MLNIIILSIVATGIAIGDLVQIFSYSPNRKRKWRIVIILSLFGMLFTEAAISAAPATTQSILGLWILPLVAGVIGNYVNS